MVALSEHAACVATDEGAFRWTDGDKSWRRINEGLINTTVYDIVSYKNALYATTRNDIVKSVDGGNRWAPVHQGLPVTRAWTFAIADDVLYTGLDETNMGSETKPSTAGIYRLADDRNSWIPVQTEMRTDNLKDADLYPSYERLHSVEELVISGDTFYAIAQMGGGRGCYRWKQGDRFWTRVSPNVEHSPISDWSDLAVSGRTVYIDATENLMRSNNQGKSWTRIETFPGEDEPGRRIEGIIIMENTVYIVVSDLGVFRSANQGKTWEAVNDGLPEAYSWELYAVGDTLFAVEWEKGIFQLRGDRNRWEFVKSPPPFFIVAMEIVDSTLYAATDGQGVYRVSLEKHVLD